MVPCSVYPLLKVTKYVVNINAEIQFYVVQQVIDTSNAIKLLLSHISLIDLHFTNLQNIFIWIINF